MNKRKRRTSSSDENDKENSMDKRIKRLEEAILKQRGKKHRKKRRRHRHDSRSSERSHRRGESINHFSHEEMPERREDKRYRHSFSSSQEDETPQREVQVSSDEESTKRQPQSVVVRSSSAGELVVQESMSQSSSAQMSSAVDQGVQQTASQSSSAQMSSAVDQGVQQTVSQSSTAQMSSAVGQDIQKTVSQIAATQVSSVGVHLVQQDPSAVGQQIVSQPMVQQITSQSGPSQSVALSGQQTLQGSQLHQPVSQSNEQGRNEVPLDPEILEIMGKRFLEDRVLAPSIPKDMVVRWEEILKKGLPTEDRVALIKKYPSPSNCVIIDPPRVNPEVQASLQEPVVKRDERILAKQTKITACLAAIGKSFLKVLEGGGEKLLILEQLSDAGRLLSDLQHDESVIRKSLILANLNASFKDLLNATVPDEFLFGKQLEEKLKAAKALETSRKELKVIPKPQTFKVSKNLRAPPRRPLGNPKSLVARLNNPMQK